MHQPILHFAHANGFPASVYQRFLEPLEATYDIYYEDVLGANAWQSFDDWSPMVEHYLASLHRVGRYPVTAVGHSLGGIVILWAACLAPYLFEEIFLCDLPWMGPWRTKIFEGARALQLVHKILPIEQAKRRRSYFASLEQAFAHYATRKLFARFPQDVLWDYVRYGLVEDPEHGWCLKIPGAMEARIFQTMPTGNHPVFQSGLLPFPVYVLRPERTILHSTDADDLRRRFGAVVQPVQGGHLFVLEHPHETAQQIHSLSRYG